MLPTVWGVVRGGKVELEEDLQLGDGTRVLVTAVPADDEGQFWLKVGEESLKGIWDNPHDDVYAELLKK